MAEVDNARAPKATTAYIDGELALKANKSDMTAALAFKADQSTTYTKTEGNTHLSGKQNSPIFKDPTQLDPLVLGFPLLHAGNIVPGIAVVSAVKYNSLWERLY